MGEDVTPRRAFIIDEGGLLDERFIDAWMCRWWRRRQHKSPVIADCTGGGGAEQLEDVSATPGVGVPDPHRVVPAAGDDHVAVIGGPGDDRCSDNGQGVGPHRIYPSSDMSQEGHDVSAPV